MSKLFPGFRLFGLATVVVALCNAAAIAGYRVAFAAHKYQTHTTDPKGKTIAVDHTEIFMKVPSFWIPLVAFGGVFIAFGLMLFVSHQRSRLIPGAIIGTGALAAAVCFGRRLFPDHVDGTALTHGFQFLACMAGMVVVVAFGLKLAHSMGEREGRLA